MKKKKRESKRKEGKVQRRGRGSRKRVEGEGTSGLTQRPDQAFCWVLRSWRRYRCRAQSNAHTGETDGAKAT